MPTPIQQAYVIAAERGIMPTSMRTAQLQQLEQALLSRNFWSARTTLKRYVERLDGLVKRYITGEGTDNDLAKLRIEARELLTAYGYEPKNGFPGDETLGIPPAKPGSITDLSSERRLNLIFETQAKLTRGLAQKIRGLDRIDLAPAWELVRYQDRQQPRAWLERWQTAAEYVGNAGVYAAPGRMIARKDSPIWEALGNPDLFEDALKVDHPPFAFGSGMGWIEIPLRDLQEAGIDLLVDSPPPKPAVLPDNVIPMPPQPEPEYFIGGRSTLERLAKELRARQAAARATANQLP